MRRFLVSSGWIFAASLVLVAAFVPFDPRLSESAQALPSAVVSFNRAITDFGTFRWMLYSTGALAILAYVAARVQRFQGSRSHHPSTPIWHRAILRRLWLQLATY